MITGIGIDLCPIEKLAGIVERQGDAFLRKIYTDEELNYASQAIEKVRNERLAARWAAKEAAIKALAAPSGMSWKDVEVATEADGAPRLFLRNAALNAATQAGATMFHVSLSHAGGMATAIVILEG